MVGLLCTEDACALWVPVTASASLCGDDGKNGSRSVVAMATQVMGVLLMEMVVVTTM